MKKLINLAVAVIMMTLCTVILGACSGSEIEGDQPVRPVDPTVDEVLRNNCTENVVNTYTSDNAEIKTRSVVVPQEIGRRRVGKECRSRWSPYH